VSCVLGADSLPLLAVANQLLAVESTRLVIAHCGFCDGRVALHSLLMWCACVLTWVRIRALHLVLRAAGLPRKLSENSGLTSP
jgi:hypothetical protein